MDTLLLPCSNFEREEPSDEKDQLVDAGEQRAANYGRAARERGDDVSHGGADHAEVPGTAGAPDSSCPSRDHRYRTLPVSQRWSRPHHVDADRLKLVGSFLTSLAQPIRAVCSMPQGSMHSLWWEPHT